MFSLEAVSTQAINMHYFDPYLGWPNVIMEFIVVK